MKRALFLLINIILFLSHISIGQIASSESSSTLFIKEDGSLWAWGNNSSGQLGDGTTTNRNAPVNILPNSQWISVATSNNTSFGIKRDGTLWAWGFNNNNKFGNNNSSETQRLVPGQVGTDNNWKFITTNGNIVVGLKTDGTLWNWGSNANGELGDGTTVNKAVPTKLGSETNWSSVTLSNNSTLAIKQNGTLWAWGFNGGTFGNNSANNSNVPIQVNSDTNWKIVEAGSNHVLAIKQDGSLWTWGGINITIIGIGGYNISSQLTPLRIGTDNNWKRISAGYLSSMAIKSNGSIWSWGINNQGVSGRLPGEITTVPTQIGNELNWENIYLGSNSSIGIKSDKSIWIWGSNQSGLLGLGIDSFKKTPVRVESTVGWKEICPNSNGTTFGIKVDGTLWAWGNNSSGIFGNNTKSSTNIPIQIGTGTNWKSIVATWGSFAAIKTDGTLWTWGDNTNGYLGTGNTTSRLNIAQTGIATDWDKIFAIASNVYAIKTNGSLWAWGANWGNSISNTTNDNILSPIQVGTDLNWKSIGANFVNTIGLKTDGTLWSWGENWAGQLGLNSYTNYSTPQRIGNLSNWTAISTSYEGTIALNSSGNLWSWGTNSQGNLGFDPLTTRQILLPTQISSLNNVRTVASSYNHSGAIKTDGSLYTWGKNDFGNLGTGTVSNNYTGTRVGTDTNWDKIYVGPSSNTFAIKTDGSLWAWGNNLDGDLGIGEFGYTPTPTQLFASEFTPQPKIFAGSSTSFQIKSDGTLWAWGRNDQGQLGVGNYTDQIVAAQVGTSTDWLTISASYNFTFGIKKDGSLWAWGYNGDFGLLGIGNNTTINLSTPTRIGTSNNWKSISCGSGHVIALKSDGTLWTWGNNSNGQLGDGTNTIRLSPIQVGTDTNWSYISCGQLNSYAIKSDGSLYAWGYNVFGQIGDGTTTVRNTPTRVGTANDWVKISGGLYYAFALKSNGTLWGWGNSLAGKLGSSSTYNSPIQIGTDVDWANIFVYPLGSSPSYALKANGTLWSAGVNDYGQLGLGNDSDNAQFTQIGTSNNWTTIAPGSYHALALNDQNILYSWGYNAWGQLGKRNSYDINIKQVGSELNWDKIYASSSYSAAIKKDGTLWTWGLNDFGQLGDGTNLNKSIPTKIGNAINWSSLALGYNHALAVKTDGSLWSWGYNTSGQLGDGTITQKNTPIQIGNSTDWKIISAGNYNSAAIKNNGTLWAWGYNFNGQLGNGNNTNSNIPLQIGTATDWAAISSGSNHVLAIKANGTLWAWGYNGSGEIGDGTTVNKNIPTQIGSTTDWAAISAGVNYSIALKKDGSIWAWGSNIDGVLGDGTTVNKNVPTQISLTDLKKLQNNSSSAYHNLIQKKDGTLWSWGSNYYGRLGYGLTPNDINATPTKIGNETDWKEFAAGNRSSLAIKTDGSLWSWGYNLYGQLGDGRALYYTPTLAKPIVDINNSGRNSFCVGGSVVLTASEGGLSYTWSTGASTRSITVNTTGNYVATVTYPIGDISASDPFTVTVNPLPDVAFTTTGSTAVVNLTDTKTYALKVPAVTGAIYQWSKDGATISGATAAEYVPQENGTYKVKVTSPFGCIANSADKVVKFELADTDKDGITDNIDKCPNTTAGATIDAYGCEIFNLPAKNYSVGMGSGTCAGAKNGSIQIGFANNTYTYSLKVVGATTGEKRLFSYSAGSTGGATVSGLAKDTYNICITIDGKTGYEQCFDVIISEPEPLKTTSSFNPNSNTLVLDLAGSESYFVSINGNIEKVNTNSFSKVLSTGLNKISITTEQGCQGKIEEEIFISEQAQAFPNPTSGPISIYVPGVDSSVRVAIQTLEKTILDESRELDHSRIIKYDLSKMDPGTYLIQVSGPHVNKTLKLIKQ